MHTYEFNTLQLHAGQEADSSTHSRALPIYQTTAYTFDSSEHATKLFALEEPGNIYTRLNNPTTDVLEKRVAALEGGKAALAVASGTSAITYAILTMCQQGDEILAANTLYGGTYNLFSNTLPRLGIHTTFVDPHDLNNFEKAITPNTKALFIETVGNPNANLIDYDAMGELAKKHHIPLIVDNTFASPYLFRPLEHGANFVVHSATKYLGGHGTSMGGILVDGGNFDFAKDDRYPMLSQPEPGYHGIVFTEAAGPLAHITRARVTLLRDTGACISPFNAFLLLQGIETLSLRMERHVDNALAVAKFLDQHPKVKEVNFPALESSPYNGLYKQYFPKGAGSIFTFTLDGEHKDCQTFVDHLQLFSHVANVGDAKSLIIHPGSTTHQQLTEEQQAKSGITPTTLRVSIGLEDIKDLIHDLEQALSAI